MPSKWVIKKGTYVYFDLKSSHGLILDTFYLSYLNTSNYHRLKTHHISFDCLLNRQEPSNRVTSVKLSVNRSSYRVKASNSATVIIHTC